MGAGINIKRTGHIVEAGSFIIDGPILLPLVSMFLCISYSVCASCIHIHPTAAMFIKLPAKICRMHAFSNS